MDGVNGCRGRAACGAKDNAVLHIPSEETAETRGMGRKNESGALVLAVISTISLQLQKLHKQQENHKGSSKRKCIHMSPDLADQAFLGEDASLLPLLWE